MRTYILRRVLLMIPTLFFVTVAVFMIVRLLPGDVVETIVGQYTPLTQGDRAAVRHELGIDRPWYQQYGSFVGGAFRGDLGRSLVSQQKITTALKSRVPVSVELGAMALLIGVVIAVPIGVLAAVRQDTLIDYVARSSAIALIAIPSFWLATMVQVYPNIWWNWAPPSPYQSFFAAPMSNLYFMIFPAVILGVGLSGAIMRLTRAEMLEVLRQDYVRTAWSKGLRERTVVLRHALRNTLIPVTTLIALQIPILIGGTVVLEGIFNVPGMGAYLLSAASSRDYPVIQAVTLLIALVVVFSNLAVDLAYAYLDPRIRYS
ncbi:MAG TPA: ABC transporter permease [Dehalococcoidia bacterium]|nr:ABC transporter permease [Dehalococcoidia bacterium]